MLSANAALVAQRRARGERKRRAVRSEEPAAEAPSPPPRAADSPSAAPGTTKTSDAQQQTDALALPFVDPNALVDPVQAAAMIPEATTSAAAHAAVRAEMSPGALAQCRLRAALEVNEPPEWQLVEAVAARRAAETAAGTRASEPPRESSGETQGV